MNADTAAIPAEGAAPEARERRPRRVDPQRVSKYRSLKQAHGRLRRSFRITLAGCALLSLALCGWALRATSHAREAESLRYQERGELLQARRELERARAEVAELVAGRIPGLLALDVEKVISVGDGYVRNVAFTRVEEAGIPRYEYKLILQNSSDVMALPDVDLVLFDRVGVEIARAHIGGRADAPEKPLFPGASRSYAGAFSLRPESEPAWFRALVR